MDYIARMINRDQYNLSNLVLLLDKFIAVFLCPVIHIELTQQNTEVMVKHLNK